MENNNEVKGSALPEKEGSSPILKPILFSNGDVSAPIIITITPNGIRDTTIITHARIPTEFNASEFNLTIDSDCSAKTMQKTPYAAVYQLLNSGTKIGRTVIDFLGAPIQNNIILSHYAHSLFGAQGVSSFAMHLHPDKENSLYNDAQYEIGVFKDEHKRPWYGELFIPIKPQQQLRVFLYPVD